MENTIKSGKELIDDFFSEIRNINNLDEKTVELILSLYQNGKLTDINLQNGIQDLLRSELDGLDIDEE